MASFIATKVGGPGEEKRPLGRRAGGWAAYLLAMVGESADPEQPIAERGAPGLEGPLLTCYGVRSGASCSGTRSVGEVAPRAITVSRTSGSSCGGAAGDADKRRCNTLPATTTKKLWGPFFCLWQMLGTLWVVWWRFLS